MAIRLDLTISVSSQAEVDDFCIYHGWTEDLGVSKPVFAKRKVIQFIKDSIKNKRSADLAKGIDSLVTE